MVDHVPVLPIDVTFINIGSEVNEVHVWDPDFVVVHQEEVETAKDMDVQDQVKDEL